MSLERIIKGKEGEDEAVRFLISERYCIIARNYRTRFGEIDIIARNGGTIAFVEVKKRLGDGYGAPEEAVDFRKCAKIVKTALMYIRLNKLQDSNLRFDVIAVNVKNGVKIIEHLRDAFQPPPKYYL